MIVLYALFVIAFINLIYLVVFSRFSFGKVKPQSVTDKFPVSVIVCAKNESENLKKNIPLWLSQQHPDFELVLINDSSSDDTLEVMQIFAERDSRVKVVDVTENETFWGSKKYALTLGIKKAAHKRLLFTDADCSPASTHWISLMADHFSREKQLVLGYGGYSKASGILNSLIRFETVTTAIQYFSYAMHGFPYMGVGRNLGYTSNLFYEQNGFTNHMDVKSGDDDLFVHWAATRTNVALALNKESFTYSIPKKSWRSWFQQKRRHVSTSKYYSPRIKFLLALYYLSNLSFWLVTFLAFLMVDWKLVLLPFLLRTIAHYIVVGSGAKRLAENSLVVFLPFLDLLLVCMQLIIFISGSKSKNLHWK